MQARKKREYGRSFEERMEDFGEEVEDWGERFGERAEGFGKGMERRWHSAFGFFGPLVGAIFGAICLVVGIWALGFIASRLHSEFLLAMRGFFLENIALFFALFLFFNYAEYFEKWHRRAYLPFKPLVQAARIVAVVWVIASILIATGSPFGLALFSPFAQFAMEKLAWIFIFFALIGYFALLVFGGNKGRRHYREEFVMAKARSRKESSGTRRLYRSSKDRILGGVCGGIAEYFEVDPVIVRLLWVFGTLASFGTGILLYIIAWIIIPRNPNQKWN